MLKGQESRKKHTEPWDRKEEKHGAEWGATPSPSPERVLQARFITRGLSHRPSLAWLGLGTRACLGGHSMDQLNEVGRGS